MVVCDSRVCHDLDPRSYLQGQGHSAHTRNLYLGYNSLLSSWMGMGFHDTGVFVAGGGGGGGGICPVRTCLVIHAFLENDALNVWYEKHIFYHPLKSLRFKPF